jgi:hypothetical protein
MMSTETRPLRPSGPDVLAALLARVESEFLEMPGLRLTSLQAARLWGIDRPLSEAVLRTLVSVGFLWCTQDGWFLRRSAP